MANDSYNDHLALLNLPTDASEEAIRNAIAAEQRKWNQRLNAPQIERRQEADRKLKAIAEAEGVLLGAEGRAVRLARQSGGAASAGGSSIAQTYRNHVALLSLPASATEEQIRSSISTEQRRWMERANSPSLEMRQEAERRVHALDEAAKVLLSAEGAAFRGSAAFTGPAADAAAPAVDAATIARAIERVTIERGAKNQERDGTALLKSSTFFHKGVDYRLDELIHKKFESIKDARICTARRGGTKLFEWYLSPVEPPGQPSVRVNTPGNWVNEIVTLMATLQAR